MAFDSILQVGADTKPALNSIKKVEDALKRIQGNAFNLKLNSRNFTEPLGRITGQVSEFEKSMGAAHARVISFTASAGLLFQVTRAFRETLKATVEVEKSLTDINVIFQKSQKEIKQFGNELFKVAKLTGQSFGVVAEGAVELSRQGLTSEKTIRRLTDALILSRQGGLSATDAVDGLTAALNTFKDTGLTSTQVINKLANADAAFAVSSGDIIEALKRTGSTAQDAKVTFDQLVGGITSLKQTTGQSSGVIGNAFKSIFSRVTRGSTLKDLEKLGITVRDLEKRTLPAMDILSQLAKRISSLSDVEQNAIKTTVAGVFQRDRLSALLRDLARDNSIYAQATKVSSEATDEATKRNEELNKTLSAQANRLAQNAKQIGAAVGGNIFGPTATTLVGSLNKIFESGDSQNQFVQVGLQFGNAITKGIGQVLSGPGLAFGALIFKNIAVQFYSFSKDVIKQLSIMGSEAQGVAAVERNISNILREQPSLLLKIASNQTTVAIEAQKYTQQLLDQELISKRIATYAPAIAKNVARAVGKGRIDPQTGSLRSPSGIIGGAGGDPKVFPSLSGAINNEIRAGVPRSSIRINSSQSLAHSGNPMGLAVTNLKDEPMGLKSLGIPNFADSFRFTTSKGTTGHQLKLNRAELDKFSEALNMLAKEGKIVGNTFVELRQSVKSKHGSGTVYDDIIRNVFKQSGLGPQMVAGQSQKLFQPSFLQRNFPTFMGAGKGIGDRVKNFKPNGQQALFGAFAGATALSSIAPDSTLTTGANAGLTGGILASMLTSNPYTIGITALGAAALATAKKLGALDGVIEDIKEISSGPSGLDLKSKQISSEFSTFINKKGRNVFNEALMSNEVINEVSLKNQSDLGKFLAAQFQGASPEQLRASLGKFYEIGDKFKGPVSSKDRKKMISGFASGSKDSVPFASSMLGLSQVEQELFFTSDKVRESFRGGIVTQLADIKQRIAKESKENANLLAEENKLLAFRNKILGQINSMTLREALASVRTKYSSERRNIGGESDSFFKFGPELFNFQRQQNIGNFRASMLSGKASAGKKFQIEKTRAIGGAAATLGAGNAASEKRIFDDLMSDGVTAGIIQDATSDQDKQTLRNLAGEIKKLELDLSNNLKILDETYNEQIKTEKEITKLKKFKFQNEFKQARESVAFESVRRLEDARSQFGIGAIGGAGLAEAARNDLMDRIAVTGVQRGDYAKGFNIATRRNFQRNSFDAFQSTIGAVDDLMAAFKNGLTPALADTILQARSASDAFAALGNALSRMALEKGLDMLFTSALSKFGPKGFATGGLVTGGSSANVDTVPAMLSQGEFVLRRSAVNRIGVSNLSAINNGGFAGLQSGGYANVNLNNSTQFLGNPTRPTGMRFNIDPSLSAYALTSDINRQNQLRDQKANQFFSYRRNQLAAMAAFKRQQRGRRYGALIGAASAFGAAGIGSMGGFGDGGIDPGNELGRNSGGSIPSVLTRGEFVINRQAASRLGSGTLGRLNSGGSFNSGGGYSSIPSQENGTERVVEAIKELKGVFDKPNQTSQIKNQPQNNGGMNITVPVSVTVNSPTPAGTDQSNTQNSTSIEDQDERQEMGRKLSETIRAGVLQELEKQQRPGGILYSRS